MSYPRKLFTGVPAVVAGLFCYACSATAGDYKSDVPVVFQGMCDASGAVPLSNDLFMVADDEENILRIYDATKGGFPVDAFALADGIKNSAARSGKQSPDLGIGKELDLEAATSVDGLSFWLTSHARNKSGHHKPERFQLFALSYNAGNDRLELYGKPFDGLLDALIEQPELAPYRLDKAAKRAAEDDNAVNIEGMTARREGGVYIGFRNPVPQGQALIVTLENPKSVVQGNAPKFGKSVTLDLNGLGIRGLSFWNDAYIIAAGESGDGTRATLYTWQGGNSAPQTMEIDMPSDFNPEAFFSPDDRRQFMVLSDDGGLKNGKSSCKNLKDPRRKSFRGIWLDNSQSLAHRSIP